ncbi:MAG: alpha/beta hydrolase [Candidatus Didemnitutus sp.]|nr:alpha/beta hydrolase [Candidatus Didemnitutus sp.]
MSAPAPADLRNTLNPNIVEGSNFSQVRVFFGTDRNAVGVADFGPDRSDPRVVSYGTVVVSIPRVHRLGHIERPSLWRLELSEVPERHMVVLRRVALTADAFMAGVQDLLRREGASNSSFVFLHGYNVSFDDAARRTAQIAFDLNYRGVPVFYSWPSEGAVERYTVDWENSDWSAPNLKRFLIDYADHSTVTNIHLVAHSMGNRALTGALKDLFTERPDLRGRFKSIILAAPDLDASVFVDELAPRLVAGCDNITLYVSDGDKALQASKKVRGDYIRVGDASQRVVVAPGIETIDASGLDTSFLEHSYFAEERHVLGDIKKLVLQGLRAAGRGLQELSVSNGAVYWKIAVPPPRAETPGT